MELKEIKKKYQCLAPALWDTVSPRVFSWGATG